MASAPALLSSGALNSRRPRSGSLDACILLGSSELIHGGRQLSWGAGTSRLPASTNDSLPLAGLAGTTCCLRPLR